jgi:hypothetical protein
VPQASGDVQAGAQCVKEAGEGQLVPASLSQALDAARSALDQVAALAAGAIDGAVANERHRARHELDLARQACERRIAEAAGQIRAAEAETSRAVRDGQLLKIERDELIGQVTTLAAELARVQAGCEERTRRETTAPGSATSSPGSERWSASAPGSPQHHRFHQLRRPVQHRPDPLRRLIGAHTEAFQRRRCLVPVDNSYERKKTAAGKQP